MNVFAKLLGSEKAIESAANGIDKAFFTKEEKATNWISTLAAYEPFKVAQRLLSLMIVGVFLFVFLIAVLLLVLSLKFEPTLAIGKLIAEFNQNTLGLSVALVVGFYFGGGAIEGVVNKFNRRKDKRNE